MTNDLAPMPQTDPTELILRVFRLNGGLLVAGDRLVAGLGLTSARWQIMGAISEQEEPLSVADLARNMGNTRQAVQRIANELGAAGLIAFRTNPRHKRSQLVELTAKGSQLFEQAMALQRPWAASLARCLTEQQVSEACTTLDALLAEVRRLPPGGN